MTITKCDICKKQIKREDGELAVSVRGGKPFSFVNSILCGTCGKSVMVLLKKHKLLDEGGVQGNPRSSHASRRGA